MRRILRGILAVLTFTVLSASPAGSAAPHHSAAASTGSPPTLLYVAAGHLWLRSVDGGPARLIPTPWPTTTKNPDVYSSLLWSPDGRRVALDDSQGRLAVINLATGHITVLIGRRCSNNCSPAPYAWSPNGRYLALVQPIGNSQNAVLRVWDSSLGTTRRLLGNLAAYVAYPQWSHDSTRIAVEVGRIDTIKGIYPDAVTVDLAGHVVHLGKGQYLSWSPDDRLIGIIRPNYCGANTCDEDEIVRSSTGGAPVLLARHSSSLFDNPIWAPQPRGYAFDRWLLSADGHPTRRLAGPHERALSWRPDGSRLALQTYYPYQGTPDVLYLSTPNARRVHFYTDGWNEGCGACSKDVYAVSWGRGNLFAFSTPTYPTPNNVTVYSKLFVSSTAGGQLSRIGTPSADIVDILGFVEADRVVIIYAGKAVYRYGVATHRLSTIATGVPAAYSTAVIDPTALANRY